MRMEPHLSVDIDVHVAHNGTCWEVRRTGQTFPASQHRTMFSAVKAGQGMADDSRTVLHVHGHDGIDHVGQRAQ